MSPLRSWVDLLYQSLLDGHSRDQAPPTSLARRSLPAECCFRLPGPHSLSLPPSIGCICPERLQKAEGTCQYQSWAKSTLAMGPLRPRLWPAKAFTFVLSATQLCSDSVSPLHCDFLWYHPSPHSLPPLFFPSMPSDGQVNAELVSLLCSFVVYLLSSYCVCSVDHTEQRRQGTSSSHFCGGDSKEAETL